MSRKFTKTDKDKMNYSHKIKLSRIFPAVLADKINFFRFKIRINMCDAHFSKIRVFLLKMKCYDYEYSMHIF